MLEDLPDDGLCSLEHIERAVRRAVHWMAAERLKPPDRFAGKDILTLEEWGQRACMPAVSPAVKVGAQVAGKSVVINLARDPNAAA